MVCSYGCSEALQPYSKLSMIFLSLQVMKVSLQYLMIIGIQIVMNTMMMMMVVVMVIMIMMLLKSYIDLSVWMKKILMKNIDIPCQQLLI